MAIVRAVKSGNWSDTTVWNTGALPTSADDVYSNTFTVTIDVSPTVLSISNATATGVTAGGSFVPSNGITLTVTGSGVVAGSTGTACFLSNLTTGQSCTIVGNVTGGTGQNGLGANNNSNGTLIITGNVAAGSFNSAHGANNNAGGALNITGNCTGGASGFFTIGAFNSSTGTLTITGNVTGGGSVSNNNFGAYNNSTGTINHAGTAQAGSTSAAISGPNPSQITNLSGPFLASATGINPIYCTKWTWLNNPIATRYEIRTANLATIRPLYTADSVGGNPAASNVRSGTVYGPNSELTGTCAVPPAGSVALGVPVDNTTGTAVLTQANFQAALTAQGLTTTRAAYLDNLDTTVSSRLASASYQAPLDAAGTRTAVGLATANLDTQFSNIPANVRTNLSPELSRIDTTVSSRLATSGYTTPPTVGDIATAVWNAATSALSNLGSIGKLLVDNINATISSRLASASYQAPLDAAGTRSAIGLATANLDTQLAPLPNLDTTVSSRLATSGYTTPPTASQNASAVRTELAPELNNLDAAVSTRSTFNPATDTVANVTLVATTTNLTNPPVVPTTTEIADAVRVELTPELNHLDADVSSRLASVDYTIPPTPEQNAQAVEVQLALPLGNLDVAVSTRSTFNPATDTVAQVALVDVTTDLTNPPVVPTPEQIATAVRTELEPELERIDADVSSRLAATDYEQAPTAEQNAEAVRTELTPELERLSNCATVATTGQQIQNALSL